MNSAGAIDMEIEFDGRDAYFSKELTIYDKLALNFSKIMDKHAVKHVFVSGYVSLLFGRSRTSEGFDMVVEHLPYDRFEELWSSIHDLGFYCHNTEDCSVAYRDYLDKNIAIRFSENGWVIPNIEFKWACTEPHRKALARNIIVHIPSGTVVISTLEMQIAFKLYLGSDKDVEDARYLFELFREKLDQNELMGELAYLEIPIQKAKDDLGWHE